MKKQAHLRRNARRRTNTGLVLAGSILAGWWPLAAGQEPPVGQAKPPEDAATKPEAEPAAAAGEAEEPPTYSNWVELGVGGTFVDGPTSSFQRRQRLPGDAAFGGLDSLHWEKILGAKGFFKIDARAVLEQQDYEVKLDLSEQEKGYVRAGYRQFRTWYDGVGGYYPSGDLWLPLADRDLSLDRGEAWFEAGLTLPSWPEISLSYRHLFRDGQKDSLVWGRVTVPGGTPGVGASFWDIDEVRDIFGGKIKHTVGKTDFGLGLHYEMGDIDNSRNLRQNATGPQESYITQRDKIESDLFSAHAFSETRFSEAVLFSAGYAYTSLDTDLGGNRIYGADYDALYDPALVRGPGYVGLSGGSQLSQNVVNLNLHLIAWKNFSVIPSVRLEQQDLDGKSVFDPTQVTQVAPPYDTQEVKSERGYLDASERLELRYAGWKKWLLYAQGDWLQGDGNLEERQYALTTGTLELNRDTDFTRSTQKYTAGVNWYPLRGLNLAGQYYHKIRANDYDHREDSTSNAAGSFDRYPAFLTGQDFETDDVNARVTWRPLNNVTLISRYDFQWSTIDTKADGFDSLESAETTSHIFSESATWNPLHWLYLQATLNYVLNETTTPANDPPAPAGLVLASESDYWNTTISAGIALNSKTDLQAQYLYTRADNYVDNSPTSVPYGAGFKEQGLTASLVRRLSKSLVWTFKYGFFKNDDQATGGHTDYTAHLVYSTMAYRF